MAPSFTTPSVAQLPPDKLQKVMELEARLGDAYVVAYEQPLVPANLTPDQLADVKRAESELGVCLVAYRKV